MKIVICVDVCKHGSKLAEFVSRFDFPEAEFYFVHIVLPIMTAPLEGGSAVAYAEAQQIALDDAKAELSGLAEEFSRGRNKPAQSYTVCGAPAAQILRYADQIDADLIVVGRSQRGTLGRLLAGSVSRGIVVGSMTSVLVVQSPVPEGSLALNAVFATDHSSYAKKCSARLNELHPRGFSRLTVLNVFDGDEIARLRATFPAEAEALERSLLTKHKNETVAVAQELDALAPAVEATFEIGKVPDSISGTMEKTRADLLIVGAHGHTWLQRTMLGSVSFEQAFGEPYSVLIVRV
jgi:nucleotide-binding universal stress UspA family protein